jgi:hypothetical protein
MKTLLITVAVIVLMIGVPTVHAFEGIAKDGYV